jgi:cytochrome d ubiquinol oxidase subunit II
VRDDAVRYAGRLALPVTALVAAFGLWTQVAHGNDLTWMVLAVAVIAQLSAVMIVWSRGSDGWAFVGVMAVVAAVVVLLFGSLYPNLVPSTLNPDWSLTIYNASSTPYTLKIMSWAALIFAPLVMLYQGWTYWVFRKRITADRIPEPIGLSRQSP